jgi:hypothetical protein
MHISTPKVEGLFQAAKWVKIQALVDEEELSHLLRSLEPFAIYPLAGSLAIEDFPMPKEAYLSAYRGWIEGLKKGNIPTDFGCLNATMWARSSDSLWLQEFPGKRYAARPREPFLQVQVHQMGYSLVDKVFRSMSLTQDSIFWGLQFSFPQVFEHPEKGFLETDLTNADLFQIVRKWSRNYTIATPMKGEEGRENLPIRLGKNCFSWINRHPGLVAKGLSVLEII